jgi:hypothetical protein
MKAKKVSFKECKDLAEFLFQLEGESISNDVKYHFEDNEWIEKYGDISIAYADDLTSNPEYIDKLARAIKKDFDTEYWSRDKEGGLYNYEMRTAYGDIITECFTKQLSILTGVGYQTELELV